MNTIRKIRIKAAGDRRQIGANNKHPTIRPTTEPAVPGANGAYPDPAPVAKNMMI
jgi:hypothetical protein